MVIGVIPNVKELNLKHGTTRHSFPIELQIFMGAARSLLPRFKNAASVSARLFSSSAALIRRPWTLFSDDSGESDGESSVYKRALRFQRPTTVRYDDILPNSVSLIGRVVLPLKACKSPKFGFHTTLKVKGSSGASPYFSILLNFWDEMAEISVQHLKLNDLIYVSGRLGSYMKVDENGKSMPHVFFSDSLCTTCTFRKMASLPEVMKLEPAVSAEDIMQKRRNRLHLWQIFFGNPYEWWDNRKCKSSRNVPDFRHKDTGEVLWLQDNDPPWIKQQLQLLDSRLNKQRPGETRNAWSQLSPLVYYDT
ncbi:UNVERIFIED_CONTAM: protein OSB1, mitochondrial [Sesamum radiatum]|uniref:Protein OSB1, mitochondrial n=1 Tax=Sesamum radiatum TaxID=300843 RepID=A0AAW2PZ39_SESRA